LGGDCHVPPGGARDDTGGGEIAAAVDEDKDTIESIYEPFLVRIGFLERTLRGRKPDSQGLPASRLRPARRQNPVGADQAEKEVNVPT